MFAENTFVFLFTDFIHNGSFITTKSMGNCATSCMSTSGCTSFFYSKNLESCMFSLRRYRETSGLTPQTGYQFYSTPPEIGQVCTTNADCPFKKSHCYEQKCECHVGLSYDASQMSCVKRCKVYGNKYSTLKQCAVKRCNLKTFRTTAEDCKKRCTDEKSFVCKNIDYLSSTKQCHLCDTAWHQLPRFGRQYNQHAWTVYHRHCAS